MKSVKRAQMDLFEKKLSAMRSIPDRPQKGWIQGIRSVLSMSMRQLGNRIGVTAQNAQQIEEREIAGTITLNTLRKAGDALNMTLVYGFIPKNGSLEKILEDQALIAARKIISRVDRTMTLEDQQVTNAELEDSLKDLAKKIRNEMPKYLWD